MNIYVGNISHQASEQDVRAHFGAYGQVDKVSMIKDKVSGQSRGFGFVEMGNDAEGQAAIDGLNGQEHMGRKLTVNVARPKAENPDYRR